jgi:hypothetical protein
MTSQKGCYASDLGDCAGGISREHYFSKAMTGAIPAKEFNMGGFPWQKPGEFSSLTSDALTAKVLCRKHNEALSPLDAVAGSFFRTVYASTRGGIQDLIPLDELCFEFDGRVIERWLLKVLCGVLASGNHSGSNRSVPRAWIEVLYERRSWPEFEFYLLDKAGYTVPEHNHFKFEFYRKSPQDIIEGVTCYFMWYYMSLSLGQYTGFPGIRRTSPRMSFGLAYGERALEVKLRWP